VGFCSGGVHHTAHVRRVAWRSVSAFPAASDRTLGAAADSRFVMPSSASVGSDAGGTTMLPPAPLPPPAVLTPFARSVSASLSPIATARLAFDDDGRVGVHVNGMSASEPMVSVLASRFVRRASAVSVRWRRSTFRKRDALDRIVSDDGPADRPDRRFGKCRTGSVRPELDRRHPRR